MFKLIKGVFCLVTCVAVMGCSQKVATRVWNPPASVRDYPENMGEIAPALAAQKSWVVRNPKFGVAFSGGGTRSAPAAIGQLQALRDLDWLKEVDYISAVSGGAWATLPYMFLPETYCVGEASQNCDQDYLGEYVNPKDLVEDQLRCSKKRSMAAAISKAKFNLLTNNYVYMTVAGRADEVFARYLGNIFLRPFGLKGGLDDDFGEQKFFSPGGDYFKSLLTDQGAVGATATKSDFIQARVDRPFFIAGGTLMPFGTGNQEYFLPVEMTPYYVGVPTKARMIRRYYRDELDASDNAVTKLDVVETELGGYVEPFAYDFSPPKVGRASSPVERVVVKSKLKKQRFSLQDVLAVTGAAPHQVLRNIGPLEGITRQLGFPELIHWGVRDIAAQPSSGSFGDTIINRRIKEKVELAHGDGGHLDNIGIMPLLARRVKNILVFVNTQTPFSSEGEAHDAQIYDNIISFFALDRDGQYKDAFDAKPHNVVFESSAFEELVGGLAKQKKAGGPLVFCQKLTVRENKRFNVVDIKGYEPNVCWVYLDRSEKWMESIEKNKTIDPATMSDIVDSKGEFDHFPHYRTFFNDFPKITVIDKSNRQVNLLANLTAWTMREGAGIVKAGFDGDLSKALSDTVHTSQAVSIIGSKNYFCDDANLLRAKELLIE